MESSLKSTLNLLEFNNSLFEDKIFLLTEDEVNYRISDTVNPIKWITGHLTSSRNHVLNLLGVERLFKYEEDFKGGYSESKQYPFLSDLEKEFKEITDLLFVDIKNISDDQLNKSLGYDLPNGAKTVSESFAFWVYHEAWHLGQIAVIRRSQNMEGVVPY